MKELKKPNYKRIYNDLLSEKYPEKKEKCTKLLSKKHLSFVDIIRLNELIFGKSNEVFNQQYRSYDKKTISEILEYQKKNNLNNTQLASHFKMSRNTVTKWKKIKEINFIR